jgi:hypothetical protein
MEDLAANPEQEEGRTEVLLQHIANKTRSGQGGQLRQDVNHFIFFMPNPNRGPRILDICFNEKLSENEKWIIQDKFPGLWLTKGTPIFQTKEKPLPATRRKNGVS